MKHTRLFNSVSINYGLWVKWLVTPLVLISLVYGGLAWFNANQPEPKSRPNKVKKIRVFTYPSKQQNLQLKAYSQGEVTAVNEIDLKPQVSGNLVYVADNFVSGGIIRQGQLLLEIDPTDYELAVTQKQAKVIQARQQLEHAQAEADAAAIELASLGRTQVSDLALRKPQLEQARASLAAAKAELEKAELDLARTKIYAPFNGRVAKESVSRFQYVNKGSNVARLFSTDLAEIRLPVNLDDLQQIRLPSAYFSNYTDSQYTVELFDGMEPSANRWQGKIVRTEANIDAKTRSVYLVAQVKDPYKSEFTPLLNGSFVHAEIAGAWVDGVSLLPKNSLRNNGQLWVVDKNNQLLIVDAKVLQRTQDHIVVADLPNKTKVITSSLAMATAGMKVIPINNKHKASTSVALTVSGQHKEDNNAF
ncbi:Efflux transporter RND family, MFP subunit [Catenovulum agarivorans DS-2]|uniref:Efflux transporter RND family, MFP subunit n=1 Tax=Catenovulum agarivorans DS-2 TaxID=1328313 RepID=W7QAE2_9ALTE|nr:efflux RND transporter periplasmic adaptor subunit [Catenovulum agarivorans]EWH09774.1 Efflux transporter RND family, MFP subunit [Catenovulum agarivorans DS-2]